MAQIRTLCIMAAMLVCLCWVCSGVSALPRPDSDSIPPPPPGLAYGGIPYGSMSGNVAEYFRQRQGLPSFGQHVNYYNANQFL